jgi:site-specific recombinase XerD
MTSYVSRHTMAMTLQNNNIPREIISQILDHKDLKTTNTYLDSFTDHVIDEAAKFYDFLFITMDFKNNLSSTFAIRFMIVSTSLLVTTLFEHRFV